MTVVRLSNADDDFEAYKESVDEVRKGLRSRFEVQMKFVPKGDKPAIGSLHVSRYPEQGEFKFVVQHWAPMKNGTQAAFMLAMEHHQKTQLVLAEMTTELKALTTQTLEEKWVGSTIRMAMNHPRMTLAICVVAASIFGLNNIIELLQRTGVVTVPIPVKQTTVEVPHVDMMGMADNAVHIEASTPAGATITWSQSDAGSMSDIRRQRNSERVGTGRGDFDLSAGHHVSDELQGSASGNGYEF